MRALGSSFHLRRSLSDSPGNAWYLLLPVSPPFACVAFGITCFELWTRKEAYGDDDDLLAVLKAVADPDRKPPLRPWGGPESLPSDMPREFAGLILRCTHNEPDARPSFDLIASELRFMDLTSLRASPLGEIEGSVNSPTSDLLGGSASPTHHDAPVEVVFPPRIAAALESGRVIEPETFEECVGCFWDSLSWVVPFMSCCLQR